ncbi:MAG: HEAT repeat domain-containing protein [Elusimicrobia bacterium]|nr:HEAT repeat domain-containing protein [Elusimicrobiota bacterium]
MNIELFSNFVRTLHIYIANAAIVLLSLVSFLTFVLVMVKLGNMLWDRYSNKMLGWMRPVFEDYLKTADISKLSAFRPLSFFSRPIVQKLIVFRSFGETRRNIEIILEAYEKLGFVDLDLKRLKAFFWWTRAEAARCLGQLRSQRSKPFLLRVLKDKVLEVRLLAAWSLGRIGDPDIIVPSMEALVNTSRLAGMRLSSTVFELGEKAIPVLTKALEHTDSAVRILSLHLLGEIQAHQSVPEIINKTVQDENKEVRVAAYKALGTIADSSGMQCLIDGLKDSLWEVRAQSARGLGLIGLPEAVGPLNEAMNDRKWWVRRNAGEALTKLGEKGKSALLLLEKESRSESVRDMAAQWLDEYA